MVAKFKDYYEVLGLPPRAHVRLIEETYWEQAHALRRIPTRKAARRLSAINEAYEVLGTPHKRRQYDDEYLGSQSVQEEPPRPRLINAIVSLLGKPFRPD